MTRVSSAGAEELELLCKNDERLTAVAKSDYTCKFVWTYDELFQQKMPCPALVSYKGSPGLLWVSLDEGRAFVELPLGKEISIEIPSGLKLVRYEADGVSTQAVLTDGSSKIYLVEYRNEKLGVLELDAEEFGVDASDRMLTAYHNDNMILVADSKTVAVEPSKEDRVYKRSVRQVEAGPWFGRLGTGKDSVCLLGYNGQYMQFFTVQTANGFLINSGWSTRVNFFFPAVGTPFTKNGYKYILVRSLISLLLTNTVQVIETSAPCGVPRNALSNLMFGGRHIGSAVWIRSDYIATMLEDKSLYLCHHDDCILNICCDKMKPSFAKDAVAVHQSPALSDYLSLYDSDGNVLVLCDNAQASPKPILSISAPPAQTISDIVVLKDGEQEGMFSADDVDG